MPLNRTSPRVDLPYLRRRPKRVTSVPAPAVAPAAPQPASQPAAPPAPAAPTLSLRPPPAAAPAPAAQPVASSTSSRLKRSVARVTNRTILTPESPMVTLSRLQSAVGSLAFDVHPAGTITCVWELTDATSGIVSESSGVRASPEFGRRALVELRKGQLLIGLRHVSELRRLLVVVSGPVPDEAPQSVVASLHGGATIESTHTGATPAIVALAGYQVGGELVIRREARSLASISEAAQAYGFAANWTPPPAPRSG